MVASAAGGCGGGDGGPATLTVYVSAPLHGARAAEGRAIVDGAKLALAGRDRVGELRIRAVYLDDTGGGARWSPVAPAANARRAAEDSSTIGYIGDVDSGATRVSLPITNQAEIAQISPASTAVDLTREAYGGVDPDDYRPSGDQTFARVVPADDVQARAAARLAKDLGPEGVAVTAEDSPYGRVLSDAFRGAAAGLGVPLRSEGRSELVYYAGSDAAQLAALRARQRLVSDALLDASLAACAELGGATYVTSPFRDPSALPPEAAPFLRSYRSRFGQPLPAAAYGYEAMSLLLDAIRRAGDHGDDRGSVIDEVLATHDRRSVVGDYSIDGDGDTTLDSLAVDVVRDCRRSFDRELKAPQ